MNTLDQATQSAYIAVQMAVENAARRHLVEMRNYSRAYARCDDFSKAPKYREWLHGASRAEVLAFAERALDPMPIAMIVRPLADRHPSLIYR